MSTKITVKLSYLRQLLEAKEPNQKELHKFFLILDDEPFSQNLRLREEIEVIDDLDAGYIEQSLGLDVANWFARQKRWEQFKDIVEKKPDHPILISEGDSWFQHPMVEDTIDHLLKRYPIYSIGAAGDTLRNMHAEPEFEAAVEEYDPKIFLISGGGNDVLGEQFYDFLTDYTDGFEPGENPSRFLAATFFKELKSIRDIYNDLFFTLTRSYSELHVIVHSYDHIIPHNPNVPWKWHQGKTKSWLGDPMVKRKIKIQADKEAIVRYVLEQFNNMLIELISEKGYDGRIHHLDVRGTISKHQWYDEIHPNQKGYQNVSLKFKAKIDEILAAM